jgi:hypothetical protein
MGNILKVRVKDKRTSRVETYTINLPNEYQFAVEAENASCIHFGLRQRFTLPPDGTDPKALRAEDYDLVYEFENDRVCTTTIPFNKETFTSRLGGQHDPTPA